MDRESPEVIEREMEHTRKSLTDKVAALETQVVGTIQTATNAVQDTVQSVKSAVEETVQAVKGTVTDVKDTVQESVSSVQEGVMHTFDVRRHVDENPWTMVGGAAVAGFLTGLVVFRGGGSSSGGGIAGMFGSPMFGHASYTPTPAPAAAPARAYAPEREEPRREEPKKPGWMDELFDRAGREVSKLAEAALASVVASVRQNIDQGLPKLINNALHIPDRGEATPAAGRANGPSQRTV